MKPIQGASVFRICAVNESRWDVLRGPSQEPVASFEDKRWALAYAMHLARERTGLRMAAGCGQHALGALGDPSRAARGAQV